MKSTSLTYEELRTFLEENKQNSWHFFFSNPFLGITICNSAGIILKVNAAHYYISGIDSESLVGHSVAEFVENGVMNRSVTALVLDTHRPETIEQEANNKRFLVHGVPVFDDCKLKYVVTFMMDISLEKHLRNQLEDVRTMKEIAENKLQEIQKELTSIKQKRGGTLPESFL